VGGRGLVGFSADAPYAERTTDKELAQIKHNLLEFTTLSMPFMKKKYI